MGTVVPFMWQQGSVDRGPARRRIRSPHDPGTRGHDRGIVLCLASDDSREMTRQVVINDAGTWFSG
jgi:hypothetical protein